MSNARACARAPVQEQHRHALRVAAFFPVHPVPRVEREVSGAVGLDLGVELDAPVAGDVVHSLRSLQPLACSSSTSPVGPSRWPAPTATKVVEPPSSMA